ncbi:MAG: radical SAM protein [Candidatus Gastranaerophilales bacterium]|nr:radical SAM protein [Candidatus Gastranaerophilales bacterium]
MKKILLKYLRDLFVKIVNELNKKLCENSGNEEKKSEKICSVPFEKIELHCDGHIKCCCGICNDWIDFGDIYKENIAEIWNGKKFQDFRESILDGSYKYCHREMCKGVDMVLKDAENYSAIMPVLPQKMELSLDDHCNSRCVMCRDKYHDKNIGPKMAKVIDSKILPFLEHCELIDLNLAGEFFVSKTCKDFVKKAAQMYPNLNFIITTNGILCSPKELENLGILNRRIDSLVISLHAATPETHEKITRSGNTFNRIMKNIENLHYYNGKYVNANQYKNLPEGCIHNMLLVFVISSINYKEVVQMAEICLKFNIRGNIRCVRKWGWTKMHEEFDKYNVANPEHPEYMDFAKLLKNEIFDSPLVELDGILQNVRNS